MTASVEEKVVAIIKKMQTAIDGEPNDCIMAASAYIVANAIAVLARDRAQADLLLKGITKDQRKILDEVWPGVRAELARRKLL